MATDAVKSFGKKIDYRWVGPFSDIGLSRLESPIKRLGAVTRDKVREHYEWADVFCLPSLCEGSATVIYEAALSGLPVICTENCGTLTEHEVEGLVVPAGSHSSLTKALEKTLNTPLLIETYSRNACEQSFKYTLDAYQQRLAETINSFIHS